MKFCVIAALVVGALVLLAGPLASPAEAQLFRRRSAFNTTPRPSYGRVTYAPAEIAPAQIEWVDEKDLPPAEPNSIDIGASREFGAKYPFIIVDKKKLAFDSAKGQYFLYGTRTRAIFLRGANGDYILTEEKPVQPIAEPPVAPSTRPGSKPAAKPEQTPDKNAPPGLYKIESASKTKVVEAPGTSTP